MSSPSGSIIAVDDDPESLHLLVDVLSSEGYMVRPADSGDLALASAIANPPDLFLLDIRMPGLAGFELCRALKSNPETRDVPIMFLSALKALDDRVEGFRAGAVDFIFKPFQREELLARIQTHMELGRLRRDLEQQVLIRTRALQQSNERLQVELAERRHAEEAMRESEERFRTMADASPALIWVLNADLFCTFVNKALLGFTGHIYEQAGGNIWGHRVHKDDAEALEQITIEAIAKRQSYQVEFRALRSDNQYRWLVENSSPMVTNGSFRGYVSSCIDITELKLATEERLTLQKMESLGALSAGIAHDFNNLSASIIAEADLALGCDDTGAASREHLKRITEIAVRASEIVDLLYTYTGAGTVPAFQSVEPNAVILEMLQIIRSSFAGKVTLESKLGEGLPHLRANAAQIRRLVMNLAINAAEAVEAVRGTVTVGTHLTVLTSPTQVGQGVTLPSGEYVEISVTDTGPGIDELSLKKIFDPFFSTKNVLGRGLGLSVVQGIVRTHEGGIRVVSQPEVGTRFEILLPTARETEVTEPVLNQGSPDKLRQTVLLVDDEHVLRRAVASGLERQGFLVLPAPDGEEALNLVREHGDDIDVVVLDLTLPGISGRDVYREIQRLTPELRVILTSANPGNASVRNQLPDNNGQPAPFIPKPYRMKELVGAIRDVVRR